MILDHSLNHPYNYVANGKIASDRSAKATLVVDLAETSGSNINLVAVVYPIEINYLSSGIQDKLDLKNYISESKNKIEYNIKTSKEPPFDVI